MLATAWDKVLQQLDNWFDWLWRLLYPWKVLWLSPSLPFLTISSCASEPPYLGTQQTADKKTWLLLYSRVLWCVGNPGADTLLMWMWDTSTAGDQAPHCHLGCSERRRQCSTAVAKADPPLWLPGEYIAPRWYPFLAPLLQLWHCLSSLRTLGFLWSAAMWQHSCYSKQAGDAGVKARQSTWFTFPSPCLLKVLLGLSFSARWYEIISVSFLLLFTYTNFSDFFFLQMVPLLIYFISLHVIPQM